MDELKDQTRYHHDHKIGHSKVPTTASGYKSGKENVLLSDELNKGCTGFNSHAETNCGLQASQASHEANETLEVKFLSARGVFASKRLNALS